MRNVVHLLRHAANSLGERRLRNAGRQSTDSGAWYEFFPADFVAENLVPGHIRDVRVLTYDLRPMLMVPNDQLTGRADALRAAVKAEQASEGIIPRPRVYVPRLTVPPEQVLPPPANSLPAPQGYPPQSYAPPGYAPPSYAPSNSPSYNLPTYVPSNAPSYGIPAYAPPTSGPPSGPTYTLLANNIRPSPLEGDGSGVRAELPCGCR